MPQCELTLVSHYEQRHFDKRSEANTKQEAQVVLQKKRIEMFIVFVKVCRSVTKQNE